MGWLSCSTGTINLLGGQMYKPLFAVQEFGRTPWEFLDEMIAFYCPKDDPFILDVTVNVGRIWGRGKSRYTHTGMDIDPSVHPDVVGDFMDIPYDPEVWDILVFDPPHSTEQGKSKTEFAAKYGTGVGGDNLYHTYRPFLEQARRVLLPGGLLLVKLIDYTHRAKFHFATSEFYTAAVEFGFELQGMHILPRRSVIIDTKWKTATHPRQNACTWMVFKKK